MPLNVNRENLTKMHGDNAEAVFREIADLGGYGAVGTGEGQINIDYVGGLSVLSALRDENTAISNKAKARIAELAGVDRKKEIDGFVGKAIEMPGKAETPGKTE